MGTPGRGALLRHRQLACSRQAAGGRRQRQCDAQTCAQPAPLPRLCNKRQMLGPAPSAAKAPAAGRCQPRARRRLSQQPSSQPSSRRMPPPSSWVRVVSAALAPLLAPSPSPLLSRLAASTGTWRGQSRTRSRLPPTPPRPPSPLLKEAPNHAACSCPGAAISAARRLRPPAAKGTDPVDAAAGGRLCDTPEVAAPQVGGATPAVGVRWATRVTAGPLRLSRKRPISAHGMDNSVRVDAERRAGECRVLEPQRQGMQKEQRLSFSAPSGNRSIFVPRGGK